MKEKLKYLFLFAYSFLFSQSLICDDFKEGEFIVEYTLFNASFELERKDNIDISKSKNGDVIYGNIEWVNECDYIIKYDSIKMNLNEQMKKLNERGGLLVEFVKIEDSCMYSKMKFFDEDKEGQIIKMYRNSR